MCRMALHEEFIELCATAIAGELSTVEQAVLDAHLAVCPACRRAKGELEAAAISGTAALAEEDGSADQEVIDPHWSLENAEAAFFKRLDKEQEEDGFAHARCDSFDKTLTRRRFTYHPAGTLRRNIWMPFATATLLALALAIASYRMGVRRGTDVAREVPGTQAVISSSLDEHAGYTGYERAQLAAKPAEDAKVIIDLRRQLAEQIKVIHSLKSEEVVTVHTSGDTRQTLVGASETQAKRDEALADARAKLAELEKTFEVAAAQRDENDRQVAALELKVGELTQLVRDREQVIERERVEVETGKELLEYDRDIRELMGARDLYIAEVHDVSRKGTDKSYGRVFYTKGKSLIFYAYDLDAQPELRNARSFQAWGQRGLDKRQALSLGILYEDNASKKRWVLKADDPKTLEDIDAVFVTVEPNGGSHHPSGRRLLFAYLRVGPNHP